MPMSGLHVVVVGGEGADAIGDLVAGLPARCELAIVAAVRNAPTLAAVLQVRSKLPVTTVTESIRLEPGRLFVIPPDADATIKRGELRIAPPIHPLAPLDRLLRSVADDHGRQTCAVLLGGVGTDGVLGMKRLKESGGFVFAIPPAPGPTGEMPRAALDTGLVDRCAAMPEIIRLLLATAQDPAREDAQEPAAAASADTLRDILTLLRVRTGHDFLAYKRATLYRRVSRRMLVCDTPSISDYHRYLREHADELAHLLREFLISVTNFFRDPEVFDALDTQVMPKVFANRHATDQIRVWVPGCATGEEAYSIAMLLLEHSARHRERPKLQVFATDIDEAALAEARLGLYPETIAVDVSPARLERFFVREREGYRVSPQLRELVLFSPHNVLRDPPFSRLDLVSCRNLMIYLNRDAQNRVLSMVHFGLRSEGFLLLGTSESAESSSVFTVFDAKHRIYACSPVPKHLGLEHVEPAVQWGPAVPFPAAPPPERTTTLGELHHRTLELYAPPSVLLSGDLDVLHLSEHAGKYLELAGGEPTRQILQLIHPALRLDLRSAINAARESPDGAHVRRIAYEHDGRERKVELRVRTVKLPELGPNALLVFFADVQGDDVRRPAAESHDGIEPIVQQLESELRITREQLRSTVEQYETSLEELKASNEELQAINEELRAATEELETSKEELQSINEELTTLNVELKVKVDEVSQANNDLQNLISSTDLGVLFLDRDLNIKRFTPRSLDLFNLIPTDIGRPLAHVTHVLDTDELPTLARRVLQGLRPIERDVKGRDGRRYFLRVLPYRSLEDRIEGVVLVFVDVSDLREAVDARQRSELALQTSEARLRTALRGTPVVILSFDRALRVTWGYMFGRELQAGEVAIEDLVDAADVERVRTALHNGGTSKKLELHLRTSDAVRTYEVRIEPGGDETTLVGFDITPHKAAETVLEAAHRRDDELVASLSHELRNPLTPLKMALDVAKLADDDPAQREQTRSIIERQVHLIEALIDDLTDLAQITQGNIALARRPIELREIIEASVAATRSLIADGGHELAIELADESQVVDGDFARLVQVFSHLLSNAATYTPDGGRIAIASVTEGDRIIVHVRDTGIGIPDDLLPYVFEIFARSRDVMGRARGGRGVGLSLAKRLVELHGGRATARSAGQDRGSELTVELPRYRG